MSSIQVGASAGPGFAPIEKAYGAALDRQRVYTTLQDGMPPDWQALGGAYSLDASITFSDHLRRPYAATDIWPGKRYDAWFQAFFAACARLPHRPDRPHWIDARHEEDAKAAAGSGTYSELNDATQHVAGLAYATDGFAANCLFGVCWTGYDLTHREPGLRASTAPAEFVAVDPYLKPGARWASFDDLVGPVLDYLTAHDPNLQQGLWEFGCDARPGRAEWLAGMAPAIIGNPARYSRLRVLDYWNAPPFDLDPAGLAVLGAGYRLLRR